MDVEPSERKIGVSAPQIIPIQELASHFCKADPLVWLQFLAEQPAHLVVEIPLDVSSLTRRIRRSRELVYILIDQLISVVTAAMELCNVVGFRCFQRDELRTLSEADELISDYRVAPLNVAFHIVR